MINDLIQQMRLAVANRNRNLIENFSDVLTSAVKSLPTALAGQFVMNILDGISLNQAATVVHSIQKNRTDFKNACAVIGLISLDEETSISN